MTNEERVDVTKDDLGSMLLATVRYSLRSRGYTGEYTAKLVRRYFASVDDYEQRQIVTEIEVALGVPRDTVLPSEREGWSVLVEEIRPPKAPFTVDYRCSKCAAADVKLWRGVHGCVDEAGHALLCAACLAPGNVVNEEGKVECSLAGRRTDQVGGWLPAVPVGDTFWGYTSVPDGGRPLVASAADVRALSERIQRSSHADHRKMTHVSPYSSTPLDKNESRYLNDPVFHSMVDAMMFATESLQLTPSEVREAAMYACMRAEERRMGPMRVELCRHPRENWKSHPEGGVTCGVCGAFDDLNARAWNPYRSPSPATAAAANPADRPKGGT